MTPVIRPYQSTDLNHLYDICLKTGRNGEDATPDYRDPKLLGHFYAAPYGVLEPETCLVLEDQQGVCGYIIGTRDSVGFQRRTEESWWPALREQYPLPDPEDHSPDAQMVRLIHQGYRVKEEAERHPAHLHIDLLPRAQGGGHGKRLMLAFLDLLRSSGVEGVHLGVSKANPRAVAFYERMGFQTKLENPYAFVMALNLVSQSQL